MATGGHTILRLLREMQISMGVITERDLLGSHNPLAFSSIGEGRSELELLLAGFQQLPEKRDSSDRNDTPDDAST